jgi:L-fuconolactonase
MSLCCIRAGIVTLNVIDSHHHFWWTNRHAYCWPAAATERLARDFTPDDLHPELARCGVEGTVLVQVLHQLDGETDECLDLARETGVVRGVVGWLPLIDPDATSGALQRLRARGNLVGVRHLISNEPDPRWLLQETVIESLERLAAAGLAFDAIPINTEQFESVLQLAEQLPSLKIVINHLGRPPLRKRAGSPGRRRSRAPPSIAMSASSSPSVSTSSCAGVGPPPPFARTAITCSICSAPHA